MKNAKTQNSEFQNEVNSFPSQSFKDLTAHDPSFLYLDLEENLGATDELESEEDYVAEGEELLEEYFDPFFQTTPVNWDVLVRCY